MASGGWLQDLETEVEDHPEDHERRSELIESLIEESRSAEALNHVDVLVGMLPDRAWVAALEAAAATSSGDLLRAARARRRHHQLSEPELTRREAQRRHPSFAGTDLPVAPVGEVRDGRHLRLLPGTGGAGVLTHRLADLAVPAPLRRSLMDMVNEVRSASLEAGPWLGGTLFYGPPGCGKAHCASVVAGELGARFVSIDLTDPWTPAQVIEVVEQAGRRGAPTVLLFEHVDGHGSGSPGFDRLLESLDSARRNAPVAILGTADFPWDVAEPLRAPQRLHRSLPVLPPDAQARRQFLESSFTEASALSDADLDQAVASTTGFSFADLDSFVNITVNRRLTANGGGEAGHEQDVESARGPSRQWLERACADLGLAEGSGWDAIEALMGARLLD